MECRESQAAQVCAVVLAGGRGQRMGGVDKGLQPYQGRSLVANALERLQRQSAGTPALLAINANRNLDAYAALGAPLGAPVWPDTVPDFAGPLAGLLSAMQHCPAALPCVLTVPCDSPVFPLDLLERMAAALLQEDASIALASAPQADRDGQRRLRAQPVFCLARTALASDLEQFMRAGGRKVDLWTARHRCVLVPFDRPGDAPDAFANANTLPELQALESPR